MDEEFLQRCRSVGDLRGVDIIFGVRFWRQSIHVFASSPSFDCSAVVF
jgi:hypothetical protein